MSSHSHLTLGLMCSLTIGSWGVQARRKEIFLEAADDVVQGIFRWLEELTQRQDVQKKMEESKYSRGEYLDALLNKIREECNSELVGISSLRGDSAAPVLRNRKTTTTMQGILQALQVNAVQASASCDPGAATASSMRSKLRSGLGLVCSATSLKT
mmetsp:Transcript_471/g.1131  ORF Transcript_471/g.1131 Transcript_471/m.1131 type:complete len:156 (+) Transcript_471:200-667(+)